MSKRIKVKWNGGDLTVTCTICGKPIVESNFYGAYCDNFCGFEEDKKAYSELQNIFGNTVFAEIFKNETE